MVQNSPAMWLKISNDIYLSQDFFGQADTPKYNL
jgi:hypothetical protein